MLKISTRIFAASAMAGMLIGINTGAFACEGCVKGAQAMTAKKTVVKASKPVAKTVSSAKIAPKTTAKTVKKSATKPAASQAASAKTVMQGCPHCEKEKPTAKS